MNRARPALAALALAVVLALWALGCGGSPGDIAIPEWQMVAPASAKVLLPAHLDRYLTERPASYTLSAVVAVPADAGDGDLTFSIPLLPSLASLRVNGVEAIPLEDVLSNRYRSRGPLAWHIPRFASRPSTLHLELTVENTWSQSGWIDSVPHLSAGAHGAPWYVFVRNWNDVAAVCALGTLTPIGFTYLAMFLQAGRRRKEHGWFAVQALAASVLPYFQLGVTQLVFGRYDAPVLAVTLSGAAISSVYFTHAHFGLRAPSRFWAFLMAGVAVLAAVWSGPFVATSHVGPIIVVTVQLAVVHQLYELGRLSLKRPRPANALTFLLSWIGLGATAWDDCLSWLGIGEKLGGFHAASAGLGLFGILQAVALSREHVLSLGRSDELNTQLQARVVELEARQRDVASLNEELRRRIAERSGQLADALSRLGSEKSPAAIRLHVGDVIKGRYELTREVGAGAMGTVYEVVRLGDRKHFAMKVLSGVSGALDMARFAREAQLASHVDHPNVVSIVNVDVASSGLIFIVMELVEGDSLLGLKSRYGEMGFALDVLLQLAEGLAAIHAMGIVHRDLKPANVLVSQDGPALRVKISDFGVSTIAQGADYPADGVSEDESAEGQEPSTLAEPSARRRSAAFSDASADAADTARRARSEGEGSPIHASPLTETGALLGTPVYMAPELAYGAKNAKPPCDVFSLGVIAHELLTGVRPWLDSPAFARQRGASVPPATPLIHLCPSLDPVMADVLDACLSSEPSARPAATEIVAALRVARAARVAQLAAAKSAS